MDLYLASGNSHKKQELIPFFPDFDLILPKEKGIIFDPIENGDTFISNSLLKAKYLYNITHKPVLADDSGLCVDVLQGKPGIFSARYKGIFSQSNIELSQQEKNELLIKETNIAIEECKKKNLPYSRKCRFVCSLVFYFAQEKFYSVQETLEGEIVDSIENSTGNMGFGYDPIVFIPSLKKTIAQLSLEEKNQLSHRGKACITLNKIIQTYIKAL